MIRVDAICKRYGELRAADQVTFDVPDGQITTLLGLNGSGKSTTLRAIAGTLRLDSGAISIDEFNPSEAPTVALARLGVFPDKFGLYPRLTVREHLHHFAVLRGLTGPRGAVERVSEEIGLQDILDRRTAGFSDGQRMRTGLAIALLHDPQNIVLDEPTRGLDILGIRQLRQMLRRLKQRGRAVLFSSHVLAEVEELADRIVLLHRGRVIAIDSPAALRGDNDSLEDAITTRTEAAA